MPNWVENTIIVTGPSESRDLLLDTFSQEFATGEGLFEAIVPAPEDVSDWYRWRLDNWGCKWDVADFSLEEYDDDFRLSFQTPWSHPLPIVKRLGGLFPALRFEVFYCEDGDEENSGWYEIDVGDAIDNSEGCYNVLSAEWARREILSHTWGEGWFSTEEEVEASSDECVAPPVNTLEGVEIDIDFPAIDKSVYEEQLRNLLF